MTDYDRLAKCDCWKPRRWAGLEPLKEVQAAILSVEAGFDSQRNVIEEDYDRDIEEVFDEQEHDQALADDHGLDFSGADIHKPVVGAGKVDTDTEDHPGEVKPPGSNGNGNGSGRGKIADFLSNMKLARWAFGPEQPLTVSVENKPGRGKRMVRFNRNEDGTITGAEVEDNE